uniref:Putative LAGLIDADG homing endonuclease n=1 Tax=Lobochlamys segnis TaxID=52035 RepID=Q39560_9CHLO|nr:putative protein of 262 amino acids [Lobochlamys segnis]ALO21062.1 putative LAGLIDADG homing endonuclease [Lobochlamys segnis]
MAQVPLTEIEKSVLCGTILGDASFAISDGYKNARFQSNHSTNQLTWFFWKFFVILKDFTKPTGLIYSEPSGKQLINQTSEASFFEPGEDSLEIPFGKLKIASLADAKLTELHSVICNKNRKTIERSWLNHMNNYFLMTVWLDDGSMTSGRQGILSFNSYPADQQQIFRDYLLQVWGIETRLQDTGQKMQNGQPNCRISIKDQENLLNLLRYIAPVVPVREMLYKVCFMAESNLSLSQRWKTEVKGLVRPEFAEEIDKIYAKM